MHQKRLQARKFISFEVSSLTLVFLDFFGKVKAKTENLEKSLKDKDKHGILARVKEGTDLIQTKMQAKVDSVVKNIADATKGKTIYLKSIKYYFF